MKTGLLLILILILLGNLAANGQYKSFSIEKLQKAEAEKDINMIGNSFSNEAIIYLPDSHPIVGKKAIGALYEFVWARDPKEQSKYIVDSVANNQNIRTEFGNYIPIKDGQQNDTLPFYAKFENSQKVKRIIELNFGDLGHQNYLTQLPAPTGGYNIGQSIYFYEKNQTSTNRYLSFQVWFPTEQKFGKEFKYRGPQVAEAAANFLGWPIFSNSFVTLIETNSLRNVKVASGKKFPVLIYNHGYGGFSGVYQTVFEELASHGYIVVSVGHQDESALLMVDHEIIIPNSTDNHFYARRSAELNGRRINELQSTILNSDNKRDVREAYQELVRRSPLHKESVELWTSDTKETIKKLEYINQHDTRLKGTLDLNNIGVFGHSVGGATAGELSFSCQQIKAGINLDGFQFGNLIDNELSVPFLFVSSNSSGNTYLRVTPFAESSKNTCHHAVINGFTHDTFSDLPLIMNGNVRAVNIQRSMILGFFDKYIKEKSIQLELISGQYSELILLR
nr:hypothetical protein [uncultured Draconibacterium sp.]